MKRYTAVLWAFLFLFGCGKNSGLKPNTSLISGANPLDVPGVTETGGQGATQNSGTTNCGPLGVRAERVSGTGDIIVGSSIRYRLTVSYCPSPDIFFRVVDGNRDFAGTVDIDKRYETVSTVREQFVVNAISRSTGGIVASGVSGSIVFNVLERGTPIVNPDGLGGGGFAFKPYITIRRLGPVTALNQPAPIQITVDEAYTRLTLNDQSVPADRPLYLNPLYPNSGHYFGRVIASGPGGESAVTIDFQVPTCTHTVESVTLDSLKTVTKVSQGTHVVVINGSSSPVNPLELTITKTASLNYLPGERTSQAIVRNILTGDEGSCSAVYRQVHAPITVTTSGFVTHYAVYGQPGRTGASEVLTGAGSNNSGVNSFEFGSTSIPVHTSAVLNRQNATCGANEILVGRPGGNYDSLCSPLLPELELYGQYVKVLAYDWVSSMSCGPNEVSFGTLIHYWERPGGVWGNLYIHCAKIKFKGE